MRKAGAAVLVAAALSLLCTGTTPGCGFAEEKKPDPAHASTPTKKHPQTRPKSSGPVKGPSRATKKPVPASSKPLVFTDEDLKRFHTGGESPAPRKVAPPSSSDPLKPFKEQEERSRWQQARGGELQQKVIDLEARLKVLEQKRLSIQNPLLPRPAEPEGTRDAESGLTGEELLAKTEEEIRQVSTQLETARKDLAKFQDSNPE